MVEELVTTVYHTTATSSESLDKLEKERKELRANLQETLAKNCSLRRKDFNRLMEAILSDSERKRMGIEEERRKVKEKLQEYLNGQKELAASLKKHLIEFTAEKTDKDNLKMIITELEAASQGKGEEVFAMLRTFELHLEAFQREQEEINHKLQRLVDRGKSLRIEELRQLEAAKAREDRKTERELRREGIERLLAHFKQQRQDGRH
jgi:regulator of replication initiation timing